MDRWMMDIGRSGSNGSANKNLPGSSDPHVQEVVKAAHEELRQLMRQRAEVMKRIGTVKQTIVGLANLFGDEVLSEELLELVDRKSGGRQPGFTKACRMVLMEASCPLGAREVCEKIQVRMPPVLLRHKDPAGLGHHGTEPPGGIWRSPNRGAGKRAPGMAVGGRSQRQRLRSRPRQCPACHGL